MRQLQPLTGGRLPSIAALVIEAIRCEIVTLDGQSITQANYLLTMANFPNLRRLFIEARNDNEEREVSRKAFYNAVLFLGSVAVFSLIAQRMNAAK
ncbi:hypothetical protein B0T17DRAFT_531469 [Bombardia bombarda]|uniref:Uncharacterized protein n=1 Tax=Bombardia bombarda TaxID=252184 RepID=A0AA39X0D0_9PEZI|nr:hypothetical protein B0T17DRAFT_531469 [Bombardia bombarda]